MRSRDIYEHPVQRGGRAEGFALSLHAVRRGHSHLFGGRICMCTVFFWKVLHSWGNSVHNLCRGFISALPVCLFVCALSSGIVPASNQRYLM